MAAKIGGRFKAKQNKRLFCLGKGQKGGNRGVLVARCARSPTTYLSVGFTRQGKEKMDAERAMPSPTVFSTCAG